MMDSTTIITPQEAKDWCRIDGDADDTAIHVLIVAAQEAAAAYTGISLDPTTCPAAIKQAVAVFVADLYANREGKTVGVQTFHRLLNPYRTTTL